MCCPAPYIFTDLETHIAPKNQCAPALHDLANDIANTVTMSKNASNTVKASSPEQMQETFLDPGDWDALDPVAKEGFTVADQQDMNRMGKQQQFRRNFRFITTVGFTCCVMGTWEILMVSNTQALLAGGSAGLFWSLCWSYCGQAFIVLSLAEMSSMAPTAGGQYRELIGPRRHVRTANTIPDWVSEFAPAGSQKLLSYLSGQSPNSSNREALPLIQIRMAFVNFLAINCGTRLLLGRHYRPVPCHYKR